MKSLKYVIIPMLIVLICKKITPGEDKSNLAHDEFEKRMENKTPKERAKHEKQTKKRFKSTVKKYNPDTKTATVDHVYVGVFEYNKAVTPPNLIIPAMVPFGTIDNPKSDDKKMAGSLFNLTTLWGIPVIGSRIPVKEEGKNKTIGYLWANQNHDLGIAQMNQGTTYVGVKNSYQPNYINSGKYGKGGVGPVWTWYSDEEYDDLKQQYGIAKPSIENVKEIGSAKINRQKYKLYGIELPDLEVKQTPIPTLSKDLLSRSLSNTREKEVRVPFNHRYFMRDEPKPISLVSSILKD